MFVFSVVDASLFAVHFFCLRLMFFLILHEMFSILGLRLMIFLPAVDVCPFLQPPVAFLFSLVLLVVAVVCLLCCAKLCVCVCVFRVV